MLYYVVRRGGHHAHDSFLNNVNITNWPEDHDFGSIKNAYRFENPNDAHKFVRKHKHDFQGSVIRTDGEDLYELEEDPRGMPVSWK